MSADTLVASLSQLSISEGKHIDLPAIAKGIVDGRFKNVIVMTGAGISCSAGIPDFRTPGTGLYDNLQKYDLPHPTAVFELDYFRENPKPFCLLAKELFPGEYAPTPTHHFIKLLHDRGVLLRNYTQNIDGLEFLAGVPAEKVVQAHGGFSSAHCIACHKEHEAEHVKAAIMGDQIPECADCKGLVKPDIVFFGESLPERFHQLVTQDFPLADLLIVMGTSLQVQPFAGLINRVPSTIPRLLINREIAGQLGRDPQYVEALRVLKKATDMESRMMVALLMSKLKSEGFDFGPEHGGPERGSDDPPRRDYFLKADCDAGVEQLLALAGEEWLENWRKIQTACPHKSVPGTSLSEGSESKNDVSSSVERNATVSTAQDTASSTESAAVTGS